MTPVLCRMLQSLEASLESVLELEAKLGILDGPEPDPPARDGATAGAAATHKCSPPSVPVPFCLSAQAYQAPPALQTFWHCCPFMLSV